MDRSKGRAVDWSRILRRDLFDNAKRYAEQNHVQGCYCSRGGNVLLFQENGQGHGNFLPASYRAIVGDQDWKRRLEKRHQQAHALPPEARELDSSNSSDALLMNVFCFQDLDDQGMLAQLFDVDVIPRPKFGVPGCVPLLDGSVDKTEIDMCLGDILVEAKLTERDFTSKAKAVVEGYRSFEQVFEVSALPQSAEVYHNYQLIRNVLATWSRSARFFLICDARRPDLVRAWWTVMRAVRPTDLRLRCHLLFWQEIAAVAPRPLSAFLRDKYGISACSHNVSNSSQ